MTTALISDIHANATALRTVLAEIDALGIEETICLGDVAGYGPQVNECCDILRSRGVPTLMGNHDYYLGFDAPCPRSTAANECLAHQRRVADPGHLAWLRQLPRAFDFPPDVRMIHGGWNDPLEEYLIELRPSYFQALEGRYFYSGHTHVQGCWELQGKRYCNPGSVGQPRDGDPRAAFAILDGDRVELRRIAYDIDEVADCARRQGFAERLYANLFDGVRIGGKVSSVTAHADG